jgi:diguanylate cyclase (GGDEF)-like protein
MPTSDRQTHPTQGRGSLRVVLVGGQAASRDRLRRGLATSRLATYQLSERELEGRFGAAGLSRDDCDAVVLVCENTSAALLALRDLQVANHPLVLVLDQFDPGTLDLLRREGASEVLDRRHVDLADLGLLERAIEWAVERYHLSLDLRRARELSVHLAHHDTLTDLPNRQFFRSRLRQLIAQAERHKSQLAILFLDLDRFKQINDTLGHVIGDRLIQEVARRLQACIRTADSASRCGGDEFNLILADVRRGQDAARVAKKISLAISEPVQIDGHELFTSCSIGISLYPMDGQDVDSLVRNADVAMYQAKAEGGGKFRFFMPQMTDRAVERLALEHSLRQAIEREEFVLHYQPRVELSSDRITGFEALVRWNHPDLGLIYPDEFIPVAEETGLIAPLGEWVAREACAQLVRWKRQGFAVDSMAVNVSARQFRQRMPIELVNGALEESGLEARHLEIEITESAVMQDARQALETLEELRKIGVSVAIDDFGTGQSSLAYLKRFPLTKLKIDKAFIRTLLSDPRDAAITRAIIAMAHSLGLVACAEGVETRKQLDFLRDPGCDEVQGYVYSPPLPVERATRLLSGADPFPH